MIEKEHWSRLFGIESPWAVTDVEVLHKDRTVKVHVSRETEHELTCPQYGTVCRGYDSRRREWRQLDTCQYRTILVADVPRVACPEHGVVTVSVPWAEPRSRFTMQFESMVIDWLQEASISAVAHLMGLGWSAIDGIMQRAVARGLMREGYEDLKGSKYDWLMNPANMTRRKKTGFQVLRDSTLKTAGAWAIKEMAMSLWHYVSRTWAEKGWKRWLSWAMRCRLEPVKEAARTIRNHLWGILNAVVLKVTNGPAQSINSKIRMVKIRSRGFRNKQRFANAIYFHLGGLDLHPQAVKQ